MKKYLMLLLASALLVSCNQTTPPAENSGDKVVEANDEGKEDSKSELIQDGDIVKFDYVLKTEGEVFEDSADFGPATFVVGETEELQLLQEAMIGMKVGDKKNIDLSSDNSYGEYDPENLEEFKIGETLETPYGGLVVISVGEDTFSLDGNHFLAGKTLEFKIKILSIEGKEEGVVETGDNIGVEYTGTTDGEQFDSNVGGSPLEFEVGAPGLIEGFTNGVVGMAIGEEKTITISPAEGYGERSDENILSYSFDKIVEVVGEMLVFKRIDDETIAIDLNHPLAGKQVEIDITILEITPKGAETNLDLSNEIPTVEVEEIETIIE